MKKTVVWILLFALLVVLNSCSSKDTPKTTTTTETEEATLGDPYLDALPKRDYNMDEFNVLCTTQTASFYDVTEENTGDVVPHAVFSRNSEVSRKYSVSITHTQMDGNGTGKVAFAAEIKQSVLADKGHDLIVGQQYYCLPAAVEGNLHDLATSSYLHWDESWYSQKINENAVVNGKIWGASGTYVMSQISYAMAILYNKELWQASGFTDDLYQLVRDKEWTYEKFSEFVIGQFQDVNNNSTIDNEDSFGLVYNTHGIAATLAGSNLPFTTRNEDGSMTILNYYSDRLIEVFESYYSFYNDTVDTYKMQDDYDPAKMIASGKTLFACAQLGVLTDCGELKNSEYHIGILPLPMYDSTQDGYLTYTMRWELFYIPVNADLEKSSIVLEYLNYTSEQIVIPAYWEKALNKRAADAPQDSEMMYLVKDGLWYDFVTFFNHEIPMRDAVASLITNRNSRIANWWKSNKDGYETKLAEVLSKYG